MKRAVICVPNPWDYIPLYEKKYSIMVLNPSATPVRNQYLLDNSDWSLYVTADAVKERAGQDYPNERALWYTSGTTGDSKFCSFSHDQIEFVCRQVINSYNITANDRYIGIMGLWHAHGQLFYWLSRMVDMETHFLPISKLASLHTYSPTFITAIPDILKTIMRQPFDSLRFVRSASSALYDPLYKTLRETLQVPVVEAFGMTESCSHCFTNPLDGERRMGSVGLPDGVEARVLNEHLYIRGPSVSVAGWMDTGDLARVDNDGYYYILGRARDRIDVRGYKLDPISLEQHISTEFPEILECAVFGTDSVKCVYAGPVDVDKIVEFLKSLGSYCRPSFIEQVVEIPKNASGKVSRTMLNELFA
jgi:acyl-coenzyme A synthetase/AMP-(fatty) acid ligase